MNPENYYPTETQENPRIAESLKEEAVREEVKGLSLNTDALRNTLSILSNVGLEALKSVFRKN